MGTAICQKRPNTITRANIKAAKRPDEITGHRRTQHELLQYFGIVHIYYKEGVVQEVTDARRLAKFESLS